MEISTYVALSGQYARQREMKVLANNIANMSTPGFKQERLLFSQYVAQSQKGGPVAYVTDDGNNLDMRQGPLTRTGNSLDVALNGEGWLAVTTPSGTSYTRDGHLQLNAQGQLVTTDGYLLQGDGGAPISVPANAGAITIGTDGTVSTPQGTIGHIPVFKFANEQLMVPQSGNLYTTKQTPQPATSTKIMQGMIEGSNVQPILAITQLLTAAHQLTAAKDFSDGQNTLLKNAIDQLGKTI